jgi:hypothetical protein
MSRFFNFKYVFLVLLAISLSLIFGNLKVSAQTPETAYETVMMQSAIPTRFPSTIPLSSPAAPDSGLVWARALKADADEYIVSFDRAQDCSGVTECSFGSIQGTRLSGNEVPLSEVFQYASDYGNQKGPVTLANNIQGYFAPAEPGLYDPATVVWDENGVRYRAVLYMASKDDVLAMANSAIQRGN